MTDRTADAGRRGVTGAKPPASAVASRRHALALGARVVTGGGSRIAGRFKAH